jgi:hypothetical protein
MTDEASKTRDAIESILPDPKARNQYLTIFLESILEANKYGANKWGAYYTNDKIRLLVGSLIVLTVEKHGLWVTLDKQLLDKSNKEFDLSEHSDDWRWDTGSWSEYKAVPSKNGFYAPSEKHPQIWPIIRRLHFEFISNVARRYGQLRESSKNTNMPDLLAYLRYTLNQFVPEPVYEDFKPFNKIIERIQLILERKGQVIFYGPPGTGKTYWAEKAACELAAESNFDMGFDQLSAHQKSLITGDGESFGAVRTSCFHPAYGYEDFIEGYRPEQADGQMIFSLRDGVFKRLCKDALESPETSFYLIIDEINRGDIPRIFGELMTIIEKDKRGKSITLPTSGEQFKVPNNVLIIGTMNTADRSISLLDAALRRRFGFIELMPDPSVLGGATIEGIHLGRWLEALNQKICENVARDARNLQIGHSYLLRDDGTPIDDFSEFARALHEDIIPLLEEYCYEDYNTLEKILGSDIVNVDGQKIRHELFKPYPRDNLIQMIGSVLFYSSEK